VGLERISKQSEPQVSLIAGGMLGSHPLWFVITVSQVCTIVVRGNAGVAVQTRAFV